MDEIATTELGRKALEIANDPSWPEDTIAQLQSLLKQAATEVERSEIGWAIEGAMASGRGNIAEIKAKMRERQ